MTAPTSLSTALAVALAWPALVTADPLPSWNDGDSKARIIEFVERVTDPDTQDYVPPADRIAVFDNDGTLWSEQPLYFQFYFALDQLAARAEADPALLDDPLLKSAVEGDMAAIAEAGTEGLLKIVMASYADQSVEDFIADARAWLATARHPETGLAYTDMVYQPMLELLRYLRDEDFETFIVSGGGIHFVRAFSESAYNIPPQNVVGTTGETSYSLADGVPTVTKDPGILFIDDKAGKPVGIDMHIGRRPIFAAGNSDGDFEMLEWSTAGEGPRLGLIVHHTDAEREWAYDRDSHVGQLVRGLDEGPDRGWVLVDMAADWAKIWPKEPQ
ncbi:HAD family hydrolase [Oceanomicrobium pacificus]|uniref:Haloacid dehalogenase-like hydrolase n=1 Tax=Oceanomicrobium pacificus TaxID=2692916 RepID=A0A6B0TTZ8_9RHOB|nr:HAD family hydrolase [Oceanomicrobium pacificus]MXU65265.1 haloacid dehalogenase-like hydrolase [Oceanomicrobium pacificus]